jgi:23S rRNA pseudouridine1911/1915/1917 synthase
VRGGEEITVTIEPARADLLAGEPIPLDIIYEDDHLVVVNKPAGMVTHPARGNFSGTLVNALLHHLGDLPDGAGTDRPGIVHRLDKETSGLMVVARTDRTYLALQKAISRREVRRTYHALVCGHVKEDSGVIDRPIGRSPKNRKKMAVVERDGKEAVTEYRLIDRFRSYDLLEIQLHTGRTHQIRVHFSHFGHPVFGDPDYGGREKWHRGIFAPERPLARRLLGSISRQALHARRLEFAHPEEGRPLTFEADLPDDFAGLLELLDEEGR